MIVTRKIQLVPVADTKEGINESWQYIRKLSNDVFKAANLVISNKFFNETFVQRIMLTDKELALKHNEGEDEIKKLNKKISAAEKDEEKTKLIKERKRLYKVLENLTHEAREKTKEFYLKTESTEIYHIINKTFPEMPSYITSSLVKNVLNDFFNDWFAVQRGERSIRNYKKGIPIPFMKSSLRFEQKEKDVYINWVNGIKFYCFFGRDASNNRIIINRIINDEYNYSDSAIQIKDKKIFLLLAVDIPNDKKILNKNIAVGVDLGLNIPVYLALSEGKARKSLGDREGFLKVRLQIDKRQRSLYRNLSLKHGGRGRRRKKRAMENFNHKEKNWVKTYNHNLSNNIVNFALQNEAGIIKLEFLEGYGKEDKNKFILRNWSYYQLQQMIKYKAGRIGIDVVLVDPYHTSQTCAVCGHYEEGQRFSQAEFLCKNHDCKNKENEGEKKGLNAIVNADYNAALNIAKSKKFVNSKEDCYYFKNISESKILKGAVVRPNGEGEIESRQNPVNNCRSDTQLELCW